MRVVKYPIAMKKSTLFKSAILALLVCVGFAACENNSSEVAEEPETYTVKLGWAGEILDVSYEPMATRAATDDLYGIQVYSKPKTAGSTIDWTPYAYGLFDDPDKITITLASGYKYYFKATMIKDGKNRLYFSDYNNGYNMPFVAGSTYLNSDNRFYYDGTYYMFNVDWGEAVLPDNKDYSHPNIERFYGELSDYIPDEVNENAQIDMKRTSFGAKFVVGGKMAVDGKLEIQINGAPKMELALTADTDEISDIFSFFNIGEAWRKDDYTEDIAVNFKWIRADGTEAPLGTHTITFKRNVTTVVNININKDGNDESLGIAIDESETGVMPDGDEVTITNGQME